MPLYGEKGVQKWGFPNSNVGVFFLVVLGPMSYRKTFSDLVYYLLHSVLQIRAYTTLIISNAVLITHILIHHG